jgi:cell wall-associated NlpC family hydrolase
MAAFPNWERALLRALRIPITRNALVGLAEWQRREGGTASFNPLNTTQPMPGASSYNSVGVRNYRTAQQGILATAHTLQNGRYNDILHALRSGHPLGSQASLKVWGTGTWQPTGKGAGAGGAVAAPLRPLDGQVTASAPVQPAFTVQDALRQGLSALASGNYDPMLGLAALRRAALSTAAAAKANAAKGAVNYGSMSFPVMGDKTSKFGSNAARIVQHYLGTPYVWGGESTKGFDCSGLLQWVWGKLGVKIPRTTYDQFKAGKVVKGQLRPGDAVFFRGSDPKGGLPGHVGMYIGGGQFIEAPHSGAVVRISNLKGRRDYQGARRYA